MLVTRILGACPGCRRPDAFGNVDVFGSRLVRGCGFCKYTEDIPLPPVRKKVIYLDQLFYSHAFRGGDQRFVDAAQRIEEVAAKQLLAAPRSSIHENETQLWSQRDRLHEFIKRASRGAAFKEAFRVVQTQIARAFDAWVDGGPSEYRREESDAVDGDLHKWEGYFWIDVGGFYGDPEVLRDGKERAVEGLIGILGNWRASTLIFEEQVKVELREAAKAFVDSYVTYAMRMARGDFDAMVDSPVTSMVIDNLMQRLPRAEAAEDRLRRCVRFLVSDHFQNTPVQLLSARIFAALRDSVKSGAYTNADNAREKLKGVFYDIEHVATYAPYCDAIFVDQPMAELVAHPGVALESRYGVKVFGRQELDALFAWLADIESTADNEHNAALAAINAPGKSGFPVRGKSSK